MSWLYLIRWTSSNKPLLSLANVRWSSAAVAMVTDGPVVGMSSTTAPHSDRGTAAMEIGFWCQHVTIRTMGEMLQTGDEVADGAMAVSPADKFTQTVRGGLNRVGHDKNLEQRERRKSLQLLKPK